MTDATTDVVVRSAVTVAAPVERAFTVFTAGFETWWPAGYHLGDTPPVMLALETGPGGRWFERAADGTECEWGRVRVWEPPRRLVLSWEIGGDWTHDPDPEHASEVEVRFTPAGPDSTLVELEHRAIERHPDWERVHEGVSSPGGWPGILDRYAQAAA